MITKEDFRQMSLQFSGCTEKPHFDRQAFRGPRRIFATVPPKENTANLKLTPEDQQFFIKTDSSFFPVPNKWGQQGWTTVNLDTVREEYLAEALHAAFRLSL